MKSVVVKYSKMESPIREKVDLFLKQNDPEFIDFPYKGKMMRGFIFNFKDCRYLIINDVVREEVGYEEEEESTPADDMADIESGFDGEGEDGPDAGDDDEDDVKGGGDDDEDEDDSDEDDDEDED